MRFSNSTSIELGEESQVVVMERRTESRKETSVAAMRVGKADGRLNPPGSQLEASLELRTQAGWITAHAEGAVGKGVQFQTQVGANGKVEIRPLQGDLNVLAEGRETAVVQGKVLTLKGLPAPPEGEDDFAALPPAAALTWKSPQKEDPPPPPPELAPEVSQNYQILSPAPGAKTSEASITVRVRVAESIRVFLNGAAIMANTGGIATTEAELEPGMNKLDIMIVGPKPTDVRHEMREVVRE